MGWTCLRHERYAGVVPEVFALNRSVVLRRCHIDCKEEVLMERNLPPLNFNPDHMM
jgi:hypothetical protein